MSQILFKNQVNDTEHLESIDAFLDDIILNGEPRKFHIIVPTGKIVRKIKQDFIRKYFKVTGKPVDVFNIFTLKDFVGEFYRNLFNDSRQKKITTAYRMALIEDAVKQANLSFFKKKDGTMSYAVLSKLANVIFGLKEDGITPAHMEKRITEHDKNSDDKLDKPKYSDIFRIYSEYENLKTDIYLDDSDILFKVNQILQSNAFENGKELFKPGKTFFFYGFSEFKQPELEFLINLLKLDSQTVIRLDYIFKDEFSKTFNGPLFGNMEKIIFALNDAGYHYKSLDYYTDDEKTENCSPDMFLRRWLFNTEKKLEYPNLSKFIKIFAVENRVAEVKLIAKKIRWLALKQNVPLSEICVVSRQPETYSTLFREIFHEYKIPVNISDRFHLASNNVVISVFAVLDLVINGFLRKDINKILNSRYLTFAVDGGLKPDAISLFNIALKMRIEGGRGPDLWEKRMKIRLDTVKKRLNNPGDDDDFHLIASLKDEAVNLEKAINDFTVIRTGININPKSKMSPSEFKNTILNEIILKFNIKGNIKDVYEQQKERIKNLEFSEKIVYLESIEKDASALNRFIQLLNEFCFILEDRYKGQTYKLAELTERLRTVVFSEKYQIREKQGYGVSITSIEQIREIPFKVAFLCGAIDREFPVAYRPEVFLGEDLPDAEENQIAAERMQFYQFLTNSPDYFKNGEKEMYISFPKFLDDEELVTSPFIDALLRISTLEKDGCLFDVPVLKKIKGSLKGDNDTILNKQLNEIEFLDYIASANEKHYITGKIYNEMRQKPSSTEDSGAPFAIVDELSENELRNLESRIHSLNPSKEIAFDKAFFEQSLYNYFDNISQKVFSVSELETYRSCPYQYLLKNVFRLPFQEKEEAGLTALESGSLYHAILYRLFNKYREALIKGNIEQIYNSSTGEHDFVPININLIAKNDFLNELYRISKEELDKVRFPHPFFDYQEREILGTADKAGLIEVWANCEYDRKNANEGIFKTYYPILFELSFGIGRGSNVIPAVEVGDGLKIRGKIDRVEWNNENSFIIADYKTTKNSTKSANKIIEGKALQLPIYMSALQKIAKDIFDCDWEPEACVYYILNPVYDYDKKKYESFRLIKSDSKHSITNFIEIAVKWGKDLRNGILDGNFPINPSDGQNTCKFCSYTKICRIKSIH